MKKIFLIGLGIGLVFGPALAVQVRIGAKGSWYSSENATFREVYGGGLKVGLEAGVGVLGNVSIWAGADYLRQTGGLTVTRDETKVRLLPLTAGVRYDIPGGGKLRFHVGAGIQRVDFKEESMLGTVSKNAIGFLARGGCFYRITDALAGGLVLSWSTCGMKNEDISFKVGGLDLGVGIEYRF